MRKDLLATLAIAVLAVSILTIPMSGENILNSLQKNLKTNDEIGTGLAVAEGSVLRTHTIDIEAVEMPDDIFAYKMKRHMVDGKDITSLYSSKPSIPGPTIVLTKGDEAIVTLINKVSCDNFPDMTTSGTREVPSISKIGIYMCMEFIMTSIAMVHP